MQVLPTAKGNEAGKNICNMGMEIYQFEYYLINYTNINN